LRWAGAITATLLLHLGAAWWLAHAPHRAAPHVNAPVQVELLSAQRVAVQAEPARVGGASRAPARNRGALVATMPSFASAPAPAAGAVQASAAASEAPASEAAAIAPAPASAAGTGERFSLPPPGDLVYDTFFNGVQNPSGTIVWQTDGRHYRLLVAIPLPFVGTFSYTSEGHIDAFGLAPERYSEQRGRRAPDVTSFDHAARTVAFTRRSGTLPLPDGAQDRFSMFMQLASLVRGDPQRYRPGVTRQFAVFDDDSGETWPIETVGMESVPTRSGAIEAVHFMRLPRRENDRRRIDVWLAPSLGWLPARLVQTEPNGTEVELLLHSFGADDAASGKQSSSGTDLAPAIPQPSPAPPSAGRTDTP
jgi:hypothetical protein